MADEHKIERLPGSAVGQEYLAGALLERVQAGELQGFIVIEFYKDGEVLTRWTDGMTTSQLCLCAKSFDVGLHQLLAGEIEGETR